MDNANRVCVSTVLGICLVHVEDDNDVDDAAAEIEKIFKESVRFRAIQRDRSFRAFVAVIYAFRALRMFRRMASDKFLPNEFQRTTNVIIRTRVTHANKLNPCAYTLS